MAWKRTDLEKKLENSKEKKSKKKKIIRKESNTESISTREGVVKLRMKPLCGFMN